MGESCDYRTVGVTVAIISFRALDATLRVGHGTDQSYLPGVKDGPGLSYSLWVSDGESLELTTGEKLKSFGERDPIEITAGVAAGEEDELRTVGSLSYWPARDDDFTPLAASILLDLRITKPVFDELLLAARNGHYPNEIMVEVEGLTHGYAPDGSEMKWDNASKEGRSLKVVAATFRVPLGGISNDDEDNPITLGLPPTRGQMRDLAARLREIALAVKELKTAWWTGLIILLAVFLYFRQ